MFTGCVESAGVAQLVRASGSYPLGPGFKSLRRHHLFVPGFSRQPFNLSVWVRVSRSRLSAAPVISPSSSSRSTSAGFTLAIGSIHENGAGLGSSNRRPHTSHGD